jgi:RHS repeat-associated protein
VQRVGGATAASQYDAWGQYSGGSPGFGDVTPGYAGQSWDTDSGLSYAQQRWMIPQLGRFASEDPIGATGQRLLGARELNGFGYAGANPLRWADPNGERLTAGERQEMASALKAQGRSAAEIDAAIAAEDQRDDQIDRLGGTRPNAALGGAVVGGAAGAGVVGASTVGAALCTASPAGCIGAGINMGLDAARQGVAIAAGDQGSFDPAQSAVAGITGFGAGAVGGALPAKTVLYGGSFLSGYQVGSGAYEISEGHQAVGAFDIAVGVLSLGLTLRGGSEFQSRQGAAWDAKYRAFLAEAQKRTAVTNAELTPSGQEVFAQGPKAPPAPPATDAALPRLSRFLRNKFDSIQIQARALGNRGVRGSVSIEDALELGRRWVGKGARMMSNEAGWVSEDGQRTFRFPAAKKGINPMTMEPWSKTGVVVNFEQNRGAANWSDVHLDVEQ